MEYTPSDFTLEANLGQSLLTISFSLKENHKGWTDTNLKRPQLEMTGLSGLQLLRKHGQRCLETTIKQITDISKVELEYSLELQSLDTL